MKCIITTQAHMERFRAYDLAKRVWPWPDEILVVCDDHEQAERLARAGVERHEIRTTKLEPLQLGAIRSVAPKRQWIQDNLVAPREWYATMDDNIRAITGLPWKYHGYDRLQEGDWREKFEHELTRDELGFVVVSSMSKAARVDSPMVGFAIENNHLFRVNHWSLFSYVRTSFSLQRNVGLHWYPFKECMFEDMVTTVEAVALYGNVLINRYVKAEKQPFESGGIGSFEAREPWLVKNCEWLMRTYPKLLTYVKGRKYSVTFQRRSTSTVNKWRCENGYHDWSSSSGRCVNCFKTYQEAKGKP